MARLTLPVRQVKDDAVQRNLAAIEKTLNRTPNDIELTGDLFIHFDKAANALVATHGGVSKTLAQW